MSQPIVLKNGKSHIVYLLQNALSPRDFDHFGTGVSAMSAEGNFAGKERSKTKGGGR